MRATPLALLALAAALAGCSEGARSPEAERGRQVYLANCVACHNTDPSQPGPLAPPIKGSARELLDTNQNYANQKQTINACCLAKRTQSAGADRRIAPRR